MPIGSTVDGPPINAPSGRWIAFKRNLRDHWPAHRTLSPDSASVESCSYSTIAIVECCPSSNTSNLLAPKQTARSSIRKLPIADFFGRALLGSPRCPRRHTFRDDGGSTSDPNVTMRVFAYRIVHFWRE
jgi:hypothetical protein